MSEERNNLMDYTGKVCVVTGSASGIGRAVCELLIAQGAVVYGLDCNEYLPHGMAQFIHTDLSDKTLTMPSPFCLNTSTASLA